MATWDDFPQGIVVSATDVASGETYESIDISTTGSSDPDTIAMYAKMPSDQVVEESYELSLFNKLGQIPRSGVTLDIYVTYFNVSSNTVRLSL